MCFSISLDGGGKRQLFPREIPIFLLIKSIIYIFGYISLKRVKFGIGIPQDVVVVV